MPSVSRDHRGRPLQPQPSARGIAPRRNVPIQPKDGAVRPPQPFQRPGIAQHSSSSDVIPSLESDTVSAYNELSYEKQQKINGLTKRLSTWESLAINAAARGESLPQARQRALNSLVRATNRDLPVETSPPPSVATHSRRLHDSDGTPLNRKADNAKGLQSSRSSSHTDKRTGKKKDSARTEGSDADRKNRPISQKWYDVMDVDWDDRMKYLTAYQVTGQQSESGEPSSYGRSPGHAKKKRREESGDVAMVN